MADPARVVIARLKALGFSRYVLHKGFIERVILADKTMPAQASFAYVDLDFHEPIRTALEFLDEVTTAGAMIIVDDYDYFSTGAKTAVQEFLGERRGYALSIPDVRCFRPDRWNVGRQIVAFIGRPEYHHQVHGVAGKSIFVRDKYNFPADKDKHTGGGQADCPGRGWCSAGAVMHISSAK